MKKRTLAWIASGSVLLALLSIFTLDRSIAELVRDSSIQSAAFFVQGTQWLDLASGKSLLHNRLLSNLLLGGVLFSAGFLWLVLKGKSPLARALLFTAVVQLSTIISANFIKSIFGRLRPYEVFAQGSWDHIWFAGGNSFPSGHIAFYWGLFLPLAYLFPRYCIPLLIIPLFFAFARIDESMHFVSDVLGSIALAALFTLIAAQLLDRWMKIAPVRATTLR